MQYNLEDMFEDADNNDSGTMSVEGEYNSYVKAPLSKPSTNILSFWSMSNTTHPTLFAMAMDYLPIQASSVPSERVFSSSAETDTYKCNRIHPSSWRPSKCSSSVCDDETDTFFADWT
jgi:hypothetical protein